MSILESVHAEYFSTNVTVYGYYLFKFCVSTPVYLFSRLAQLPNRTLESLFHRQKQTGKRRQMNTGGEMEQGRT